ncbi:rod shape-determining protein RodA [Amylibacter sp. IMCC11727]|uniref:rod shape-determining protein RodA n=1 Tax=Amylibacter sp. IMCC11727 TaxID=3039851 RepID=UPI00244E30CC|nr:rod shape-determining protein RodA [Amylibacter sp. IMCC11727]WGI23356.1 rod shape-determining protein RodA [Amylibacter sp. IMCC11727]
MSYMNVSSHSVPTGLSKVLYFNWPLALLLTAVASTGFLMLYSVSGGDIERWAEPQIIRFCLGAGVMVFMAFVPISFWREISIVAYIVGIALLLAVPYIGETRGGAQRWIDLGFMTLQPSELMKIGVVMALAFYYDWLEERRISHPLWVLIPIAVILLPAFLVLGQPDLGTALLIIMGGAIMMFIAGVHWGYFLAAILSVTLLVTGVFTSKGTEYQLLKDYQYKRIETFIDPSSDPLGSGYHITQSKIALGSGGMTGRGFMQGTQQRLNFLPEKHTDFIFTTLGEEFGFVGGIVLLGLYGLILLFCYVSALANRDRYGSLVTIGVGTTFFFYFAVNMSMVMGLAPVVGVPLPLVSYGGSAMMVLLIAFGLVQSAHVHRPR